MLHTLYHHGVVNEDDWDSEAELSDLEPFPGVLLDQEEDAGRCRRAMIWHRHCEKREHLVVLPLRLRHPLRKLSCLTAIIDAYASREAHSIVVPQPNAGTNKPVNDPMGLPRIVSLALMKAARGVLWTPDAQGYLLSRNPVTDSERRTCTGMSWTIS